VIYRHAGTNTVRRIALVHYDSYSYHMSSPTPRLIVVRHGRYISSRSHTPLLLSLSQARPNGPLTGPCVAHICSLAGSDIPLSPTHATIAVPRRHVRRYVKSTSVSYILISLSYLRISDQTGRTDIPLTEHGQEQIKSKAPSLVGEGSMSSWIVRRPSSFSHRSSLRNHRPSQPVHRFCFTPSSCP
jgi:hypothetical protein